MRHTTSSAGRLRRRVEREHDRLNLHLAQHARGRVAEALGSCLRLITTRHADPKVRRLLARSLDAPGGLETVARLVPLTSASAPTIAYLAAILKDRIEKEMLQNPDDHPEIANPCRNRLTHHDDAEADLANLANFCNRHKNCSLRTCLRKKRGFFRRTWNSW